MKVIELSDEQYAILAAAARKGNETLDQLIARIVDGLADAEGPIYYTDEQLLRALGADDEEIAEISRIADADGWAAARVSSGLRLAR